MHADRLVFGRRLMAGVVIPLLLLSGRAASATTATTAEPQRRDLATLKAEQQALTPAQVLESLRQGNERFASGKIAPRDMLHDQQTTAAGQYPHAVILSGFLHRNSDETAAGNG